MPRRSRYTVTLTRPHSNAVEKEVVLAADAFYAEDHFARQGNTVLEVRKGDYRQADATPSGAKPSTLGLHQAKALLGLRLPVEVKLSNRKSWAMGGYRAVPTDPRLRISGGKVHGPVDTAAPTFRHQIIVKSWLSAEDMGRTLWHELKHAQQFEREALPHGVNARKVLRAWHEDYFDGTGYKSKRQERQADAAMRNNDTIPLAR